MNVSLRLGVRVLAAVVLPLVTYGSSQSLAQRTAYGVDPYRHTYHPEHGYVPVAGAYGLGAYGYGYGGTSTAGAQAREGAAMQTAAAGQAAADVGQMHVSNAKAQDIHQQAVSKYLNNVGLAQETAINYGQRRQQAEQQHTEAMKARDEAQVALYNKTLHQMSAAHRLTAEQFDLDRGVLHWPFVLRGSQYAQLRQKLDHLYNARTPEDSGKDSSGYDAIQQACKQMQEIVNAEVKQGLPVNDYVTAKHFISSVAYEAQFPVKPEK